MRVGLTHLFTDEIFYGKITGVIFDEEIPITEYSLHKL